MKKWEKLKLSFLGKIATIKMNILLRFMFLFQTLPIIKKESILDEWQRGINNFMWAEKKPRIKAKCLMDTKERGGLQLPNLKIYHEAAGLSWIAKWIKLDNERILNIEGFNLLYGWHAYLYYQKK